MEWNPDPTMIRLGFLNIRYYSFFFAFGLGCGFLMFRWQLLKQGYSKKRAEDFFVWAVLAIIVGSRLGHCLFYNPSYYLHNPIEILYIWEGGLASHGAAIAIIILIFAYHYAKKIALFDALDSVTMPTAVLVIAVRLGNFMNSEIVGRVTDVPWAIMFHQFNEAGDVAPQWRHPSQLYEVILGIGILTVLLVVERSVATNRPKGLLTALFLCLYFTGRFILEYFKEYQFFSSGSLLTMGQILSMPFAIAGFALLLTVLRRNKGAGKYQSALTES